MPAGTQVFALDAAMPFDFEHKATQTLKKQRALAIAIIGFGTFGQFLAKRLVAAGHHVSSFKFYRHLIQYTVGTSAKIEINNLRLALEWTLSSEFRLGRSTAKFNSVTRIFFQPSCHNNSMISWIHVVVLCNADPPDFPMMKLCLLIKVRELL